MQTVLIGLQARSTSTRLPNKVNMQIGGRPMLQWVLDACQIAARYLRSEGHKLGITVNLALLVPKGDVITTLYGGQVPVIEGDEDDVLSRYVEAQKKLGGDYICRVTADCVFIPPHHISKHVRAAVMRGRDYTTNVMYRTHKEGWDCEVLSARLLDWLDRNSKDAFDREHVTTTIRGSEGRLPYPFPFQHEDGRPSICHILNMCDESDIKTSIDTEEEYHAADAMFQRYQKIKNQAKQRGTFLT